jgi:sec-independent protein translocase protein TatA
MVGDILQPTHLLFILLVALLVLGPKRLPEVGKTLGSGLRDFRQAINGEAHHDDRAPQAYVETEPDPVPPFDPDASHAAEGEPTDFDAVAVEPAAADATEADATEADATEANASTAAEDPTPEDPTRIEDAPATPTALHEHELDDPTASDDLQPPAPTDDLYAPAPTEELRAPAPTEVPAPVAAASSSGFASALASSRQRPADGGEPAADDE